jgi:hypothetical protein
VARFITSEAVQSTIQPSADGKLPELRLTGGEEAEGSKAKGAGVSPLLLLGALCLSVALSVVLVMVDINPQDSSSFRKKQAARMVIDAEYSSNIDDKQPLERYQVYLRQALQAHAQGDRAAERDLYRKVLEMLRAERGVHDKGLTGSPARDRWLEEQISVLLSD